MMNTEVPSVSTLTTHSQRRRQISPSRQPELTANSAISSSRQASQVAMIPGDTGNTGIRPAEDRIQGVFESIHKVSQAVSRSFKGLTQYIYMIIMRVVAI
ncbi:MAG: hypothetical protein LC539_13070 [Candidatus Thiodiazotropha sp.]|nr:hypothetical protein [Candidatus Thiodiazotropha sp.]MCM8922115.1 hypothetical protein [Candidatus Thiodiazotropha sp.]